MKPHLRAKRQDALDRLLADALRIHNETGLTLQEQAWWLLYQVARTDAYESARHELMAGSDEDKTVAAKHNASLELDEQHSAESDESGGAFVDHHFDRIAAMGRRYDPGFTKPILKQYNGDIDRFDVLPVPEYAKPKGRKRR